MNTTFTPAARHNAHNLTGDQITTYRRDGFITLQDVFVGDELAALRDAVADAVAKEHAPPPETNPDGSPRAKSAYEQLFIQRVNL